MTIKGILFRITAVAMVFALFIAVEGVLRAFDVPAYGKLFHDHNDTVQLSRGAAIRYFSAGAQHIPEAYPETFDHPVKEGTIRIICLGGSTMAGYPYSFNGTLPSLIRDALLQRNESRPVEVLNFAIPAVGSHTVRDLCRHALTYRPDVIVVYTGHNEFYGALGGASTQKLSDQRLIHLHLRLQDFHLYRLLWRGLGILRRTGDGEHRAPTLMGRMVDRSLITAESDLYTKTLTRFSGNIDAIYALCSGKAELVLCEVVSNLRDQPPFEPYEISDDFAKRIAEIDTSIADSSATAASLFSAARTAEESGEYWNARRLYALARDHDGLRFRASSDLNDTLRALSRRSRGHLVALEAGFNARSVFVSPGYDLFIDHLHPNHHGYLIMAEMISEKIEDIFEELDIGGGQPRGTYVRQDCEDMALVTQLDHAIASDKVRRLMDHWPFPPEHRRPVFSFDESIRVMARRYHDRDIPWSDIHLSASSYHLRHGRFRSARREAQAVLKQAMGFWPAWVKVGDSFLGEGSYDAALSSYRYARLWAEKTGGSTGSIRAKYASTLLAAGKPDEAAAEFERILADGNELTGIERPRALYMLGICYMETGDFDAAKEVITQLRRTHGGSGLATRLEQRS